MDFMRSDSGAFYTSQDADAGGLHGNEFYAKSDSERRASAQPPIDRNSYARENGWAIASLAALYDVTGDKLLLEAATRAFDWTLANRRAPNGGFGHARAANDDTHLGDTLSMAEAAMALYRSTAQRHYLGVGVELADVIRRDHRDPAGGYMVRAPEPGAKGVLAKPVKQLDENVAATRLFNLLARNTGSATFRADAEHGMRYLISLARTILSSRRAAGRSRTGPRARPCHDRRRQGRPRRAGALCPARRYPTRYLRIEWFDRREGPLPAADIDYPEMPEAAAFACANAPVPCRSSRPARSPASSPRSIIARKSGDRPPPCVHLGTGATLRATRNLPLETHGNDAAGRRATGCARRSHQGQRPDEVRQGRARDLAHRPVIVDFWAPWCGPCKTLQPMIEKVVKEAKGAVKLVKIDIDKNQMLAQQLRIQSIPAVYAFFGGRPVDGFMGAVPESQVKEFVDRLIQASGGVPGADSPAAQISELLEHAKTAVAQNDLDTAAGIYSEILGVEPTHVIALTGLARYRCRSAISTRPRNCWVRSPPRTARAPTSPPCRPRSSSLSLGP